MSWPVRINHNELFLALPGSVYPNQSLILTRLLDRWLKSLFKGGEALAVKFVLGRSAGKSSYIFQRSKRSWLGARKAPDTGTGTAYPAGGADLIKNLNFGIRGVAAGITAAHRTILVEQERLQQGKQMLAADNK